LNLVDSMGKCQSILYTMHGQSWDDAPDGTDGKVGG